jgi:hypothetical protein
MPLRRRLRLTEGPSGDRGNRLGAVAASSLIIGALLASQGPGRTASWGSYSRSERRPHHGHLRFQPPRGDRIGHRDGRGGDASFGDPTAVVLVALIGAAATIVGYAIADKYSD